MQVSVSQFFDLLPIVAHQKWEEDFGGEIRNSKGECPLCAVINELNGRHIANVDPEHAIQVFTNDKVRNIRGSEEFITAADNYSFELTKYQRELRSTMKLLLGLK